jgi:SAM-dependent methyltransferase
VTAPTEDTQVVRDFFDHWAVYQTAVAHNYIHHLEAMAALHAVLSSRGSAGAVVDLGCGDAAAVPTLLDGVGTTSYTGVDVSAVALGLAGRNMAPTGLPVDLVTGDFMEQLPLLNGPFDTVIASLSMHHLPAAQKPGFFGAVLSRIAADGLLMIYEPSLRPDEDRAAYIARQSVFFTEHFTAMTPERVLEFEQHVQDTDFPETPGTYAQMALDAGFASARVIYVDPEHFWAALAFTR